MGLEVERTVAPDIIYTDEGGGRPCLFERFGDDQGRDLMVVVDFRAGQKTLSIELALCERSCVLMGNDRDDTRGSLCTGGIDGLDQSLGNRCTNDIAVCSIASGAIILISVGGRACRFESSLDPVMRFADDAEPIDRIGVASVSNFMAHPFTYTAGHSRSVA